MHRTPNIVLSETPRARNSTITPRTMETGANATIRAVIRRAAVGPSVPNPTRAAVDAATAAMTAAVDNRNTHGWTLDTTSAESNVRPWITIVTRRAQSASGAAS